MGMPRSTYYQALASRPDDASIVAAIAAITDEFELYGYRRVTAELRARGLIVNAKKVRRLMRENGLNPRRRRRFVTTTDSDHDGPIFPNLAKDMTVDGPNQLWVADITYVAIAVGFVYLAMILDTPPPPPGGVRFANRIDGLLTIDGRARSSAMLSAARSTPASQLQRCKRRSGRATRRGAACIIPTVDRSTPPTTTGSCCTSMASSAQWGAGATPTTMPRPRAS